MATSFGITKVTGAALLESVEIEHKADVKVLLDNDGAFSQARIIDDSFTFSVKGKGSPAVDVGVIGGGDAPTGVSGTIICTSLKEMQSNDGFEGFEYSGVAYPHAT